MRVNSGPRAREPHAQGPRACLSARAPSERTASLPRTLSLSRLLARSRAPHRPGRHPRVRAEHHAAIEHGRDDGSPRGDGIAHLGLRRDVRVLPLRALDVVLVDVHRRRRSPGGEARALGSRALAGLAREGGGRETGRAGSQILPPARGRRYERRPRPAPAQWRASTRPARPPARARARRQIRMRFDLHTRTQFETAIKKEKNASCEILSQK